MPEHLRTGRRLVVAAVALLWAAAAQAAPQDGPAKGAGAEDASPAISLDQLGGTWKNIKSGVNVRIEQGAAGWEVWFSTSGEARITLPEKNRPAIKIDGRNFTCSYSVTLPSAQTMKWDLTQGQPEAQCPTGVFTRLEPAPVKQPAEAKKPAQAAAVIEPAPISHARPLWTPPRMMPRPRAAYRRPPARFAIRHRFWRIARAPWPYAAGRYRPYRYFHHRYRWYVVLIPRCGCR